MRGYLTAFAISVCIVDIVSAISEYFVAKNLHGLTVSPAPGIFDT